MKFRALFFFLLLACLYLSLAQGSYENCCLKYGGKVRKSTRKMVVSYRRQETDGGCNIPAIVLTKRTGGSFCVDPNTPWVKRLMMLIDKKQGSGAQAKI